jgi:RNA polymerase sigma-70 factor (ECF subfamily)
MAVVQMLVARLNESSSARLAEEVARLEALAAAPVPGYSKYAGLVLSAQVIDITCIIANSETGEPSPRPLATRVTGAPQLNMASNSKLVRIVGGTGETTERARAIDPGELVRGLKASEPWAERALLHAETARIERMLTRILGFCAELDDLTQEVFIRAFARISELREAESLRAWLGSIAVFVARETIRRKRRRRWLLFLPAEELLEPPAAAASIEARAALRVFYEVLDGFATDERIAFTLRFVEGMELTEVAEACQVSLATIKRRLKRASDEFYVRGRARAELVDWFEEGSRWRRIEN